MMVMMSKVVLCCLCTCPICCKSDQPYHLTNMCVHNNQEPIRKTLTFQGDSFAMKEKCCGSALCELQYLYKILSFNPEKKKCLHCEI